MEHGLKPLVSVIIPTYNRAKLVLEAVQNVSEQTYDNIEIIVVDDGSTDNTREILLPYSSHIVYLYKNNSGCSSARNFGIARAKGEYIAFLDSDDLWHPDKLKKQIHILENFNDYAIVFSDIEYIDERRNPLGVTKLRKIIKKDGYILEYILKMQNFTCSNLMLRKCVFQEVGLFDEQLETAEDMDLIIRACFKFNATLVDEPLLQYRKSKDSISYALFTGNRLKVLEKLKQYAPEFVRSHKKIVLKRISDINLSYAEDLLLSRYIKESQKQIYESLKNRFSFKAAALLIKSFLLQIASIWKQSYRDRGAING